MGRISDLRYHLFRCKHTKLRVEKGCGSDYKNKTALAGCNAAGVVYARSARPIAYHDRYFRVGVCDRRSYA